MKIIAKKSSLNPFREKLVLKCEFKEETTSDSFFGRRLHWVIPGERYEVSAPKGHYEIGEEIEFATVLNKIWTKANWRFKY